MRKAHPDMEIMSALEEVTEFADGYTLDPGSYLLNQDTAFMQNAEGGLLAFTAGVPPVHPPRNAYDLAFEDQKFMKYPKGIGTRIANIPHALIEPLRHGKQRDIYAVEVSPVTDRGLLPDGSRDIRSLYDERDYPKIRGYVRHAGLLAISKRKGPEKAWQTLDQKRGLTDDIAAVQLSLPPSWQDEHRVRGIRYPVNPEMMLLRDPEISVRTVGTVAIEKLIAHAKNL